MCLTRFRLETNFSNAITTMCTCLGRIHDFVLFLHNIGTVTKMLPRHAVIVRKIDLLFVASLTTRGKAVILFPNLGKPEASLNGEVD